MKKIRPLLSMLLRIKFFWVCDLKVAAVASLYKGQALPSAGEFIYEASSDSTDFPRLREVALMLMQKGATIYLDCRNDLLVLAADVKVRSWLYPPSFEEGDLIGKVEALARVFGRSDEAFEL